MPPCLPMAAALNSRRGNQRTSRDRSLQPRAAKRCEQAVALVTRQAKGRPRASVRRWRLNARPRAVDRARAAPAAPLSPCTSRAVRGCLLLLLERPHAAGEIDWNDPQAARHPRSAIRAASAKPSYQRRHPSSGGRCSQPTPGVQHKQEPCSTSRS